MGPKLNWPVTASKKRMLQISFLVLFSNGACMSPNQNFPGFSPHWNNLFIKGREDAANILKGESEVTSYYQEVGMRIAGKNAEESWRESNPNPTEASLTTRFSRHQQSAKNPKLERASEDGQIDQMAQTELQAQVVKPLFKCLVDSRSTSLKDDAMANFLNSISKIINTLQKLCDRQGISNQLAGNLPPAAGTERNLQISTIPQQLKDARTLLKNPDNFEFLSPVRDVPSLSIGFRLDDLFLRFLGASERYHLMSEDSVAKFLNEPTEGTEIFHYILGYLPSDWDVTAFYLNYDSRRSILESGFTEDIHGLLKHVDTKTWQKIEKLHIEALFNSNIFLENLLGLKKHFDLIMIVSSVETTKHMTYPLVEQFFEDAAKFITQGRFPSSYTETIELKVLHTMLCHMLKYGLPSEKKLDLMNSKFYPHIQVLDKAIAMFSSALQSVYFTYGKVLQKMHLSPEQKSNPRFKPTAKIYLAAKNQNFEGSLFSIHDTVGDDGKNPVMEDADSKPNHPFLPNLENKPVNSHRKSSNLDLKDLEDFETIPGIKYLKEASQDILNELKDLRCDPSSASQDQLATWKGKLETLLEEPF